MENPMLVLLGILAVGAVFVALPVFLDALSRYRNNRKVTCPKEGSEASIHIDAKKAALAALAGGQKLVIDECSEWNGNRNCKQDCLEQLTEENKRELPMVFTSHVRCGKNHDHKM